jgi:hypothetical protein
MLCALHGARTLLFYWGGAGFHSGLPVDAKIEKGVAPFLCPLRNVVFAENIVKCQHCNGLEKRLL